MIAAAKGFAVRFVIVCEEGCDKWYCSRTKNFGSLEEFMTMLVNCFLHRFPIGSLLITNLLEHISTLAQTCLKLLLSVVECVNSLKNRKVRPFAGISFLY